MSAVLIYPPIGRGKCHFCFLTFDCFVCFVCARLHMHAHNFAIVVVLLLCTKSTWKINFPSQTNDCNRYGYHTEVMARSQLQALLLQRVPSKRIVAGKVLGMIQ